MPQIGYLIIAISVLVALLVIFIISFILYRRTPVPAGCENVKINDSNCASCGHKECRLYKGEKE